MVLEFVVSGLTSFPLTLYCEKSNYVVTAKSRPGVILDTAKLAVVSSISLYIGSTVLSDTGNYTCVNDTANTETVLLVVTESKWSITAYSLLSEGIISSKN